VAITKEKKDQIYKNTVDAIKNSQSMVFVNFHGLNVGDTTTLRRKLKEENVTYVVTKKTLAKKALEELKLDGEIPQLDGELALAYADDLTAPARGVYDFQKTHKDNISILGGIFEGRLMGQEAMMEIATIPATPVLYSQFVNLINSPIQGLVIALNGIAEKKA